MTWDWFRFVGAWMLAMGCIVFYHVDDGYGYFLSIALILVGAMWIAGGEE